MSRGLYLQGKVPGRLLGYHVLWPVSLREGPGVVARIPCHVAFVFKRRSPGSS